MNSPASADFELTTIAILNDMKFDHSLILTLMDKLITECARLSHVIKVVPLSREHAAHFGAPKVVPLLCSWSPNPVNFLFFQRQSSPQDRG